MLSTFQLLLLEGTAWGLCVCEVRGQQHRRPQGLLPFVRGQVKQRASFISAALYTRELVSEQLHCDEQWWTELVVQTSSHMRRTQTLIIQIQSVQCGCSWITLSSVINQVEFYGEQLRSAEDQSVFVIYDHCWSSPVSSCKPLPAGVTWCKQTDDLHE